MLTETIDLERLKQQNPPLATCDAIGISGETAATTKIDAYFNVFAVPNDNKCLSCGAHIGGLLGAFTWDICWGEWRCSVCGYPGRAHHRIRVLAVEPEEPDVQIDNLPLQYHPRYVERSRALEK
jgi:hypothetical protein